MKKLYILRHAKTERHITSDYERSLTNQGIDDCRLLREYIEKQQIAPQHVYCSGASRARETFEYACKDHLKDVTIDYTDKLYVVRGGDIIRFINAISDDTDSVMLVGHNPGVSELMHILPAKDHAMAYGSMPTGSLAYYEFQTPHWHSIEPYTAKLINVTSPKMLAANQ